MKEKDKLVKRGQRDVKTIERPPEWNLPAVAGSESVLTWEQVVRVLRKRVWLLVTVISGLTLAISTVALMMSNVYQPTARLEIDPQEGGIKTLHEIENSGSGADLDYLDTQVQILQSDGLAMRVIRALHLDRNSEFVDKTKITNSPPSREQSQNILGLGSEGSYFREQLELADSTLLEATALRALQNNLSVNPIKGSRLVEVSFASHDPKVSQAVCNSLVTQFIDQNYRNRYVTTMEASEWLSSQLNDLRQKVSESNHAVADYQKRYGLVESDARDVPLGQLMAEVSRQMSNAEADRIEAEASVRMIDAGQWDTIPALRDDAVYQTLQTRRSEVLAQLAQAQAIYGDENVNLKKLQSEANELATQVEAERQRMVNRVRNTFAAAKAREQMMMDSREKLRGQMGDASSHLVEYGMLKNEALANAELYNTLRARLREAGIYAGLKSGNIRVVDMAPMLRVPTGPHRGLIITVGFALSTMLALVLAFVRESFDNTVRIPDDIRNWTRLPSLAILPTARAKGSGQDHFLPRDVIPSGSDLPEVINGGFPRMFWSETQSAEAEAIRALRTALLFPASGSAPKVILVSSASAGEGKTTVAINLASVLAQQARTCLVEGDLRRPMIEQAMGLNPTVGLAEVLNGKVELKEALVSETGVPGLSVLPIKSPYGNPSDLLASVQMISVLRSLSESFEYIVIDSPPVIPFSDARSLALLSDAVILVSRYGRTTRRAITRGAELLDGVQAPVLGVVLNDMDLASADYHYFNYGFSWAMSGRKYAQDYQRVMPLSAGAPKEPEAEKSKGAHA